MKKYSKTERLQESHFNTIASEYAKHYGDTWSQAYRYKFIKRSLFENIRLLGMNVLDAMCGNGETTEFLQQQQALVTGFDIFQ